MSEPKIRFKVGDILRLRTAGVPSDYTITNTLNDVRVISVYHDHEIRVKLLRDVHGNLYLENNTPTGKVCEIKRLIEEWNVDPQYFVYSRRMKLEAIQEVLDE